MWLLLLALAQDPVGEVPAPTPEATQAEATQAEATQEAATQEAATQEEAAQAEAPPVLAAAWESLPLDDLGSGARLGQALALGDFDGDGWIDLAASAPGALRPEGPGRGVVLVAYAAEGGLLAGVRETRIVAPPAHQPDFESLEFGHSLCAIDLDDDPEPELAIGAPRSGDDSGSVWVWGIEGAHRPARMILPPGTLPGGLGHAMCTLDLEGDGSLDLVIAAPQATLDGVRCGALLTFSARGGRRVMAPVDPQEGGLYGFALGAADLLPGGPQNLVVSEPGATHLEQSEVGRVWVHPPMGTLRRPELCFDREPVAGERSRFGVALAAAGPLLAVGAPGTDREGRRDVGRVLFAGRYPRLDALLEPGLSRDALLGSCLLFADLGGGSAQDLVAPVWGAETPEADANRGAWVWQDLAGEPCWLPAPAGGGARWARALLSLELEGSTLLLAGDPSFDREARPRGDNHGRVTLAAFERP
ncbi:MAG: hypothetical protein ISQ08_12525 [Planctomycetes bacterium]|nr:hypothetical protein [Planctomycetota bacterium]